MPELPEVETVRRGLEPLLAGRRLRGAELRNGRLRQPVPADLHQLVAGRRVQAVERRAKYLLLRCDGGALILHLGMSGSLRLVAERSPPGVHDHLDLLLPARRRLRLHDPRRFGLVLWTAAAPELHPLLRSLGREPLGADFHGAYLHERARGRSLAVKNFLMDGRVVAGVGNIYASEALFRAGVHPARAACRLSLESCERLAAALQETLRDALAAGGTTLRDFQNADGMPGYFERELAVYGRNGLPCPACGATIRRLRLGQRSTYYCKNCQR